MLSVVASKATAGLHVGGAQNAKELVTGAPQPRSSPIQEADFGSTLNIYKYLLEARENAGMGNALPSFGCGQ